MRRVLLWCGLGVVATLVLAWIALLAVLSDLARPSIKARVRSLAQQHAGLAIDYDALEISPLHGAHAHGLRLLQPPKFRGAAQEFVVVDDLEVRAEPWRFARGERTLELVRVTGVQVTLVRDEHGSTSVSELFPAQPEPEPRPAASKLSESLAQLPALDITRLEVGPVSARLIDLHDAAPARTLALSSVGLQGQVHSQPRSGLAGSALVLAAAPQLQLQLQQGAEKQLAKLALSLDVRSDAPDTLVLSVHSDVLEQDFRPELKRPAELLHLVAKVVFDPAQQRTLISCSELRAVAQVLTGKLELAVFDPEPLRVTADGTLKLDADRLPVEVPGLRFEQLALTLQAEHFAWQAERLAGKLAWQGGAQGLAYESDDTRAQLARARLSGKADFDGPSGQLEAQTDVESLTARTLTASAQLSGLGLTLHGKTHDAAGAQQLEAALTLALSRVDLGLPDQTAPTRTVELTDLALEANTAGAVAAFNDKRLPSLQSELSIAQLATSAKSQRVALGRLGVQLTGKELAADAGSPSGARGDAELALSLPELRVWNGAGPRPAPAVKAGKRRGSSAKVRASGAAVAVDELALHAQFPLALSRATAELSVASGATPDFAFRGLQLKSELAEPLAWSPAQSAQAELQLTGRAREWKQLAHAGSAANSGALDNLQLTARKRAKNQYQLELDAASSELRVAGKPLPGRLSAELRGGAEPDAGHASATLALRGASGAAVDVSLDGALAKKDERLRYKVSLSAEKLDAFASLIEGAVPSASALKIPGARVRAAAQGDLAGVLTRARDGSIAPAPHPITSVRGQQALELDVSGVDYHTPERNVVMPKLSLRLSSVHGEGGAGHAEARCSADSVKYDGDGSALQIEGFEQSVSAEFAKAPDQGTVELRAKLALGSLAQSQLPAYRVAGLHFDAHLQIERLRSIFLRELALDNPAAGTRLTARGALELRPHTEVSDGTGSDTIAGREALALDGRLEQDLEPFAKLGFAARASGRLEVPFRLESGGLLGYRLLATLEAKHISLLSKDEGVGVEDLNGVVPMIEEFALLPSGLVMSAGPRASPLSETRFFDVHPFLSGTDYVTARSIALRGLPPLGPFAANVRIERSDFLIDQLQVGWNSGQIVGQVRIAYREGDPLVRMRLNATGLRAGSAGDVLDANATLSFVPNAMTLDGKVQLVRVSRAHLLGILDTIDPFHESAGANRVRTGLALGYPKFVRFQLHDGALDTKVELGGLASAVRIDEIRAVPMGPILQRYVVPTLSNYVKPNAAPIKAQGSK